MREIKFRGKRIDNGEWVYGFIIQYENGWFICNFVGDAYQYEVDPFTIGQYIEHKDINKKEIYEGDVVECYGGEYCQGYREFYKIIVVDSILNPQTIMYLMESENVDVLGNIYDNPKLLDR